MTNKRWLIIKKLLGYEVDYFLRKVQIGKILFFIVSLLVIIITGLGDTQSFFIGENSPIPKKWEFLKDPQVSLIISLVILIFSFGLAWWLDLQQKNKETNELLDTVQQHLIPLVDNSLNKLKQELQDQFKLTDMIRISLWIPVIKNWFNWNLQMICKTENIEKMELEATFKLDEGVVGYTYLKSKNFNFEFIDVSDPTKFPPSYIELRGENKKLINPKLKGVLVATSFQEGSILGLLAIDTDNVSNLQLMQQIDLHRKALQWIMDYSGIVKLLWRQKNNV